MTCIVAFKDSKKIYLGCDLLASGSDGSKRTRKDTKIFQKEDMLIGFTSSYRMGQLLRYSLDLPKHAEGVDTFEYMVTSFVDAVQACLSEGGFQETKDEVKTGGSFIVVYKNRIFTIHDDYQVAEDDRDYASVGSGENYALGSLYSSDGRPTEDRVLLALKTAAEFSQSVGGPFEIISTDIQPE